MSKKLEIAHKISMWRINPQKRTILYAPRLSFNKKKV